VEILDYNGSHRQSCVDMFLSNTPSFFAPVEQPLFESWLDDLEKGRQRKDAVIYNYVLFEDQLPVASGGFYVGALDHKARMAWGMVHRAHHRRGLGREFLNFRIRRIRQMFPYSLIALDTTQFSFGFYEKQGFVVTGITKDFYAPGMDRYDMEFRADNIIL
jgi:ribosomal-protein-alanine N-acetyltransferase